MALSFTNATKNEIKRLLSMLETELETFLHWPNLREWQSFRGNWPRIAMAVAAIDGTSHEINRPVNNQGQFYSGHSHYHCVHTQIVVDNTDRIRHIESGFF